MWSWHTIWTRVWPGLSELSILTETLVEVSELGSSSGISKGRMFSVIAVGRNEDSAEHAVISGPTISMSQLIMEFPVTAFKWSHVSSFLLFVCRSSLIKKDSKKYYFWQEDNHKFKWLHGYANGIYRNVHFD